jgi:hypothetical protein
VRTIGQGFYALELAQATPTDVLLQLTTSSLTVPAGASDWRLLADRVVYARSYSLIRASTLTWLVLWRQASSGDNVKLYPATASRTAEAQLILPIPALSLISIVNGGQSA